MVKALTQKKRSDNSKKKQEVMPSTPNSNSKNTVTGEGPCCKLKEVTFPRETGWVSMGRLLGGGPDDHKEIASARTKRSAKPPKTETNDDFRKYSTTAALPQDEIRLESESDVSAGKQSSHCQNLEDKVIMKHQEMIREMRQRKRNDPNADVALKPQSSNDVEESHTFLPEPPSQRKNENDRLDLGIIHTTFKMCLPPTYALRCTLLLMAAMALADSISSYELLRLLVKQTFTIEALILGIVEYSALPLIVLHYIITKRREKWGGIWPEVLTGMTPIAQTLGLLYWTGTTFKEGKSSTRVHNFVTLNSLLRGVVVSPLMIVAMSYFYLTEVLTPPWQETTTFCDSMHNCVPLGILSTLLPLIRFGFSLVLIFIGFLEGYQAEGFRKLEIAAFSLPSSTYRAATLILTATYANEYALILLFLVLLVNVAVDRLEKTCKQGENGCFSKTSERGNRGAERTIINLVSALSSIVDISVVPANPADQERNPKHSEDPARLKQLRNISTKMSLASFPIFLVANICLHLLSQLETFQSNPNNVLSTDQIIFLTLYVLYPLAAMSFATLIFFHLTFLSSRKYFKAVMNMLTILATFFSLGALVIPGVFPPGPSKIVLSIQTRDRVNFVEGLSWTSVWNRSSNEWDLTNGSFVSLDNISLKEVILQYPQNAKNSENDTIFLKLNITSVTEKDSLIKIVKPYPPSTDNTSDVECISCPDKDSNYCKRLLYEVKEKNEHVVTCKRAVDGYWTSWIDGSCQTYLEVPKGSPCGKGWQMQTRECLGREYGGKYCSGRDSNHKQCTADECPGM